MEIPIETPNDSLVTIDVFRFHQPVLTTSLSVEQLRKTDWAFDIGTFQCGGYRVVARLEGELQGIRARTAFDVRNHWREAPRYGFLSDYQPRESYEDITRFFQKFHINVVQFYDWMERHDSLVPKTTEFIDPMGRKVFTNGILERIQAMRDIGTAPIGYAAVYASLSDYAKLHPDEGIYDNQGVQYSLIDIFYLMDITEVSSWRDHILSEFERAIDFGFAGLHLDQYGHPKSAIRNDGSALWMDDGYVSFIKACRYKLGAKTGLIFNNVSSYPVHATSKTDLDAVYVEVWPPMVRYRHLSELITRIRLGTQAHKQVILAAYMKAFRENRDADSDAVTRSALLVTAIISASGGYHLVLGESGGLLTEAYYPDYIPMVTDLVEPLRTMYDIVTADGDLLSGPDVTDVTWSFVDGINDTVVVEGAPICVEPQAGTIWVRVTTTSQGLVVHLVNLLWLEHDKWDAIHYETFRPSPALSVKIEWNHGEGGVWVQKAENAVWTRAEHDWISHVRGKGLHVTVQPFDVWAIIFVPYATNQETER